MEYQNTYTNENGVKFTLKLETPCTDAKDINAAIRFAAACSSKFYSEAADYMIGELTQRSGNAIY